MEEWAASPKMGVPPTAAPGQGVPETQPRTSIAVRLQQSAAPNTSLSRIYDFPPSAGRRIYGEADGCEDQGGSAVCSAARASITITGTAAGPRRLWIETCATPTNLHERIEK